MDCNKETEKNCFPLYDRSIYFLSTNQYKTNIPTCGHKQTSSAKDDEISLKIIPKSSYIREDISFADCCKFYDANSHSPTSKFINKIALKYKNIEVNCSEELTSMDDTMKFSNNSTSAIISDNNSIDKFDDSYDNKVKDVGASSNKTNKSFENRFSPLLMIDVCNDDFPDDVNRTQENGEDNDQETIDMIYSTNKHLKMKPNINRDDFNLEDLLDQFQTPSGFPDEIDDPNLNAKYSGIFDNCNTLVLGNSHARRMQEKFEAKKQNFLIYPGLTLIKNWDFSKIWEDLLYLINVKKISVEKLVIIFGGNDVHHVSTKFTFPFTNEPQIISDLLINGKKNFECESIEPSDPLNIVKQIDPSLLKEISSSFEPYFEKLLTITRLFPNAKVTLTAPGPRYLKGTDDHINYNVLCYIFNYVLYDFVAGKSFMIINNFIESWREGTKNFLKIHGWRETISVLLQDIRYTKYGAVHYCQSKYTEMYNAISCALECCDSPPSAASKTWNMNKGIYVHYLLGNKGAHITMGNIKLKNSQKSKNDKNVKNGEKYFYEIVNSKKK